MIVMDGWERGWVGWLLTPRMPHDLISGCFALRVSTKPGRAWATPVGEFLPKKAPRSFCFSGVLGGYLWFRLVSVSVESLGWSWPRPTTQWGTAPP